MCSSDLALVSHASTLAADVSSSRTWTSIAPVRRPSTKRYFAGPAAKPAGTTSTAAVEPVTLLLVNPNVPAANLREFLDHARRNPGKLSYGSPGMGSVFHLVVEALQSATGTRVLHVPYKSLVTAINDVIGGQTEFTVVALGNVRAQIASGKLRALAVMEGQRYAELPNVPTVGEAVPQFEKPASWFGLLGPGGLPPAITQRIYQEAARSLEIGRAHVLNSSHT